MKCDEFEEHLNEILDERRRPEWDEQLREHGEQCRGCRDLAAAFGVLFEGFFALPTPQAPADLAARVLEEYQVRPLVTRRLAVLGGIFTTAAALLVAVTLFRGGQAKKQVAQVPPAPAVPTVVIGPDGKPWKTLDDVPVFGPLLLTMNKVNEDTEPVEKLARGTGQGLASIVLRMPGMAGPQGMRPLDPESMSAGSVWPLQVSEELRPVAESVTETFNLLLKALPVTFTPRGATRPS